MKFASIIVDISLEQVDREFEYIIPEALLGDIVLGALVVIPFGKGKRLINGYVVDIKDKNTFPIEKLKEIQSVIKEGIPVEAQMIKLAAYLRKNYGSTMNQALKTVIPVKTKVKKYVEKEIILNISIDEAKKILSQIEKKKNMQAKTRLLQELILENKLPYSLVSNKLNISSSTIKALIKDDIIVEKSKTISRNPINIEYDKIKLNVLTDSQEKIVKDVINSTSKVHLIHGITGSGKTEVYMEIISDFIKKRKQVIMLIPEIALTYQTVLRFYKRFGDRIAIMNSRLSSGEKADQFERAKNGEIDIMIGPRSALFTPFSNIGLIIIDEEHENAYKSEQTPKYHAVDVAIERATYTDATVVLGSATPSIETYYKALNNEYILHEINERYADALLPDVSIVDLREELKNGNKTIFSRMLADMIKDRLSKSQQVILFLNRRGYSNFISCRSCGKNIKCPHCDVSLSIHKDKSLRCHYCGHTQNMPNTCPSCGSKYIAGFGVGTQKVEEMVKKFFPEARVLRMDSDTTSKKDSHEEILSKFANKEADILVGTQMIVKGHDFPFVTLVGILAADLSLFESDFKAAEKTFQLLTQAAGRAGRGSEKGEVVIQTYSPENYAIVMASNQDYKGFYNKEILYRKLGSYPPVIQLLAILMLSTDELVLKELSYNIADIIKESKSSIILGPNVAKISKINDVYRRVIYIKNKDFNELVNIKDNIETKTNGDLKYQKISIQFDFTPSGNY